MKQSKYKFLIFLLLTCGIASAQDDSESRELLLNISYNMPANTIPYLKVTAKEKVERKFIPQKDINANVYIGDPSEDKLLSKVTTNEKGEAFVYIPERLKHIWDSLSPLKFSVITEANKIFEATTSEIEITKSKIEIDTANIDDVKNVIIKITELKNGEWLPVSDVELKISVKRSLGNLPIGDEETYTTDTDGTVTAEFKRDSLLGDANGNIILIARTEDNETLGNIFAEKVVHWGKPPVIKNTFNQRSLWATRFKTPIWLLALAYSIIGIVWGTIIYIIVQIIKIRKLGKTAV